MNNDFSNEDGKVVCPNSLYHADLTTNFKLHWCKPQELIGGVCPDCFAKFKKHNAAVLSSKIETPVDPHKKPTYPTLEQDHVAFSDDGIEPTADFDFGEVEELLGETIEAASPDARSQASDILAEIFRWCWSSKATLKAATLKFSALVAGINPQLISNKTYEEIAQECGVTKAAISKCALVWQKRLGLKFARSYSEKSREGCRRGQLKRKRKH